jgi:4'-phosphopantetheinyl transferase
MVVESTQGGADVSAAGASTHPVRVWWLQTQAIGAADWPRLASLLDEHERQRAARFHFERDRQTYIAAHALARGLLSHWAGCSASAWRFDHGTHGKPEVRCPPGMPGLRFNLSHTRGLAAVALTRTLDIGVDTEWQARDCDSDALAQRYFAAPEQALLSATPQAQKAALFLRFWTLKEAYIKAIGEGLSHPLDSFYFSLDPPEIHFVEAASSQAQASLWHFRLIQPTPEHLLALGVRQPPHARLQIQMEAASLDYLLTLD